MRFKQDFILAIGVISLAVFAITTTPINFDTVDLSIEQTVLDFKNTESSEERINLTTGNVVQQAKEIVKTECDPDIWNNWNNLTEEEQYGRTGLAIGEQRILFNNRLTINLYINDSLTDQQEIFETAWHECGHAKTYNIPSDIVEELHTEVLNNFSECKGYEDECLADAMSEVKTGTSITNGYLPEVNEQQLATAEKVWKASGKVNHINERKSGENWIDLMEQY